jgi:uncharacterized protein YydD (DUF2326 family)
VLTNSEDNIEYKAGFYDGNVRTNEDMGNTYKKLLCTAFDLAVTESYRTEQFPCIIFHDGIFEGLDYRKRELLRDIYREYAVNGLQIIVTTITSDLFTPESSNFPQKDFFFDEEIIIRLHDEGENGRLFKMPTW